MGCHPAPIVAGPGGTPQHKSEVEDMWLWHDDLQRLGFRRRSERYWRCDRHYGLGEDAYLSVFSPLTLPSPPSAGGEGRVRGASRPS